MRAAARAWHRSDRVLALAGAACGGRLFGKVYEYEEDIYLSLDGSAELIVNASVPALVALRGLDSRHRSRGAARSRSACAPRTRRR